MKSLFLFFLILFFALEANAQLNCNYLKEINAKAYKTYLFKNEAFNRKTKVIVSCTDTNDTAKVTIFADANHKKVTQIFFIKQYANYLNTSFIDVDNDGYRDMILVTAHGNPDLAFNIWKFDPIENKYFLSLDDAGFFFYRSHLNDLVIYSKGGAGYWSKRILGWDKRKLVTKIEIEIPNAVKGESNCKYMNRFDGKEISSKKLLKELANYCSEDIESEAKEFFVGK